jgi:hypothetical protein
MMKNVPISQICLNFKVGICRSAMPIRTYGHNIRIDKFVNTISAIQESINGQQSPVVEPLELLLIWRNFLRESWCGCPPLHRDSSRNTTWKYQSVEMSETIRRNTTNQQFHFGNGVNHQKNDDKEDG